MITSFRALTCAAPLTLALLLSGGQAMAQDSAPSAKLYAWNFGKASALITTPNGAMLVHQDGKPYRTFKFKPIGRKGAQTLVVADIDRDGNPNVIGVGKPSFALNELGDPSWTMPKGCDDGFLADVANDTKLEFVCMSSREIRVFTHDAQFLWSAAIGRPLKDCIAGDTNGDLKADIECVIDGKRIARFDGTNGKMITAEATESMITEPYVYDVMADAEKGNLSGKIMFDFNKDGTSEEYLSVSGTTLAMMSKSSPKKSVVVDLKSKPLAALVRDLDGDGKPEVLALTKDRYFVMSPDGKRQESYPLSPSKYKRAPVADFTSVYTSNFQDNEAAKAVTKALGPKLSSCYKGALKKSKFAGSGKMLLEGTYDAKGNAKTISKIHSEIASKKVNACVVKVLKDAKMPASTTGLEGGLNLTLQFSFRDSEK